MSNHSSLCEESRQNVKCVEHQNPDLQQFSTGCDDGLISGFMSILFFFFKTVFTLRMENICARTLWCLSFVENCPTVISLRRSIFYGEVSLIWITLILSLIPAPFSHSQVLKMWFPHPILGNVLREVSPVATFKVTDLLFYAAIMHEI